MVDDPSASDSNRCIFRYDWVSTTFAVLVIRHLGTGHPVIRCVATSFVGRVGVTGKKKAGGLGGVHVRQREQCTKQHHFQRVHGGPQSVGWSNDARTVRRFVSNLRTKMTTNRWLRWRKAECDDRRVAQSGGQLFEYRLRTDGDHHPSVDSLCAFNFVRPIVMHQSGNLI